MTSNSVTTNQKRPNSYVDVLLTAVIAFSAVGLNFALSILWYRYGLDPGRRNLIFDNFIHLTMAYFFLILFLFLVLVIRACVQGRRLGIKRLCLRVCLIAISIVVVIVSHTLTGSPFPYLMKGFTHRMQNEADILAIRAWLKTADIRNQDEHWGLDKSEWPDSIKKLSPNYTFIEMSDNNETQARMIWGGAFGHWGMVVGPVTMEIPESAFERGGEYRLKIAQGAYVWHEIR